MSEDWVAEKHVSDKVLPSEPIFSWVKWDRKLVPKSIMLKYDPDLEILKFLNADWDKSKAGKEGKITLDQKQLGIAGFFGFMASYNLVPEEEKTVNYVVEFDFGRETKTLEYSTRIARPILEFEQTEYTLNSADISRTPSIDCKLANRGLAMAREITPFFKMENTGEMQIEMRTVVEEIKDESLVFVESNKVKVPKFIIRGKGSGLAFIGFKYKDAIGNSYESPLATLAIEIKKEQSLQVPITENISAKERPIIQATL